MAEHHTSELQEVEWTFGQPSLCKAANIQLPCAHSPRYMQFLHAHSHACTVPTSTQSPHVHRTYMHTVPTSTHAHLSPLQSYPMHPGV